MLYRILTENKNFKEVTGKANGLFPDGFTVLQANGYWHGEREHSLVIEILTQDEKAVEKLAFWIKKHNKQQTVMIQIIHADCQLV